MMSETERVSGRDQPIDGLVIQGGTRAMQPTNEMEANTPLLGSAAAPFSGFRIGTLLRRSLGFALHPLTLIVVLVSLYWRTGDSGYLAILLAGLMPTIHGTIRERFPARDSIPVPE
jgi:hypothetical protein